MYTHTHSNNLIFVPGKDMLVDSIQARSCKYYNTERKIAIKCYFTSSYLDAFKKITTTRTNCLYGYCSHGTNSNIVPTHAHTQLAARSWDVNGYWKHTFEWTGREERLTLGLDMEGHQNYERQIKKDFQKEIQREIKFYFNFCEINKLRTVRERDMQFVGNHYYEACN